MNRGLCIRGALRSTLAHLVVAAAVASAQPSGGPYGPSHRTHTVPSGAGTVFYAAPEGGPGSPGTSPQSPTTLAKAIAQARTGDAVILRGGVYRTGGIRLNQGITIQPYGDEQPILKGTLPATQWKRISGGLWVTHWDRLFPAQPADWWQRDREGKNTPMHRFNNDMVFVDGRYLQSAGWEGEVDSTTCFIDHTQGRVYIGVDPTDRLVEITAYDIALLRTTGECNGRPSDGKGYVLRGIDFLQYAYRALEVEGTEPEGLVDESRHGKDVVGTTIEDCTIAWCSRVAGYFRGDRFTMRRCRISDTSTEGVYVIASNDILLEHNIFMRNNIERITGYYPAGVKIFNQCYRATCRDNLVIDQPHSNGIWYDVGNVDGVFVNNWVQGVGSAMGAGATDRLWPSDNGFFFEISNGAVCAGNVFVDCDHGLMILNASDVRVYQNTFVNSTACIGRNARNAAGDHFGWHPATGPGVEARTGHEFVNNLLVRDERSRRPLLLVWQPDSLCARLSDQQLRLCDNNVYVSAGDLAPTPAIVWSPLAGERCQAQWEGAAGLHRRFPQFESHGLDLNGAEGRVFRSRELGDFHTVEGFKGRNVARPLPDGVREAIGISGAVAPSVGALPPRE